MKPLVLVDVVRELPAREYKPREAKPSRWQLLLAELPTDGSWAEIDGVPQKGMSSAKKAAGNAGVVLASRNGKVYAQPAVFTTIDAAIRAVDSKAPTPADAFKGLTGTKRLAEFARIHKGSHRHVPATADTLGLTITAVEGLVKQARTVGLL